MRNLLRLLLRYNYFIFFILLEMIGITLMIYSNAYQQAKYSKLIDDFDARIYDKVAYYKQYFNLREVNRDLVSENISLRNQLSSSIFSHRVAQTIVNDSLNQQQFSYVDAKVINNTTKKQHNYLILDKGLRHGVREEMGVISPNGIVGVVKSVSNNYSLVLSVLNTDMQVSAKIKKNDYFGSLVWEGVNDRIVTLKEIPYHVSVSKGDTIVTTAFSSTFPEGTLIGMVEDFEIKGGNFYELKVKLSDDFRSLTNVYIVNYLMKTERLTLEKSMLKNDE